MLLGGSQRLLSTRSRVRIAVLLDLSCLCVLLCFWDGMFLVGFNIMMIIAMFCLPSRVDIVFGLYMHGQPGWFVVRRFLDLISYTSGRRPMLSINTETALLLHRVDWTLFLQACLCSGFSLGGLCTVTSFGRAIMLRSLLLLLLCYSCQLLAVLYC